jgi:hypothetical protein
MIVDNERFVKAGGDAKEYSQNLSVIFQYPGAFTTK